MSITPPANIGLFPPASIRTGGLSAAAVAAMIPLTGFAAVSGNLQLVRRVLTVAELQALAGTPITIVAGVAGSIHYPLFWSWEVLMAGVGAATSPNASLRWAGYAATNLIGTIQGPINVGTPTRISNGAILSGFSNNSNVERPGNGDDLQLMGTSMVGGTGSSNTITVLVLTVSSALPT